jgi:hypothetical protein
LEAETGIINSTLESVGCDVEDRSGDRRVEAVMWDLEIANMEIGKWILGIEHWRRRKGEWFDWRALEVVM